MVDSGGRCVVTPEGVRVCEGVVEGSVMIHQDPRRRDGGGATERTHAPAVAPGVALTQRRGRRKDAVDVEEIVWKEAKRVLAEVGIDDPSILDVSVHAALAIYNMMPASWRREERARRVAAYAAVKAASVIGGVDSWVAVKAAGLRMTDVISMDYRFGPIVSRILGKNRTAVEDEAVKELRDAGVPCASVYAKIRILIAKALQELNLFDVYVGAETFARRALAVTRFSLCGVKPCGVASALLYTYLVASGIEKASMKALAEATGCDITAMQRARTRLVKDGLAVIVMYG